MLFRSVYSNPGHDREERRRAWHGLMERFGGDVDWAGLGSARRCRWQRQLHVFIHPFYYVEYGIAQLGALQVWVNAGREGPGALARYRSALALGGSRPLPELFAAAGCRWDFGKAALRPLIEAVEREMDRLV